jgi:hypothetical protein
VLLVLEVLVLDEVLLDALVVEVLLLDDVLVLEVVVVVLLDVDVVELVVVVLNHLRPKKEGAAAGAPTEPSNSRMATSTAQTGIDLFMDLAPVTISRSLRSSTRTTLRCARRRATSVPSIARNGMRSGHDTPVIRCRSAHGNPMFGTSLDLAERYEAGRRA